MLGKRNRSWQYRAVGRQPVKSSAFFPRWGGALGALALAFGVTIFVHSRARAQDPGAPSSLPRPLLLGGPLHEEKEKIPLDPRLPVGRLRSQSGQLLLKNMLCSLRRPVCVAEESSAHRREGQLGGARRLLEQAYEEVVVGADLPGSLATFGEPLVWKLESGQRLHTEAQLKIRRGYDRGAAHCVGGDLTIESARRCVLEASLLGRAPATASWLAAGWAAEGARELGSAARSETEIASSFRDPQAGVLTSSVASPGRSDNQRAVSPLRSARFFGYLAARSGGSVIETGFLALSLAATQTPRGASRFLAEPDLADVVRATHQYNRAGVARFYDDFAQWSFFDQRERSASLAIDWEIDADTLPRSVAFSTPIEPTGSVYAIIALSETTRHEVMGFRTRCETPVSYVWSVTRLDANGQEISKFPLTFQERNPDASGRVLPVAGMESLLVVGTNVGGVALTHPFDPDHEPHEAHGCRLTINVVPSSGVAEETK